MSSALCASLSAAILDSVSLPDSITAALGAIFSGATCVSVALAHGSERSLAPMVVMEAGSVQPGQLVAGTPHGEGTACWTAFATGEILTADVSSIDELEFSDWRELYTKYGVNLFVTAPLSVADGVLGSICVAGGSIMDGKAGKSGIRGVNVRNVQMVGDLLAECLLRRNAETLIKDAMAELGDSSVGKLLAARKPRVRPLPGSPTRKALVFRYQDSAETVPSTIPLKKSPAMELVSRGEPRAGPLRMRSSSLMDSPELHYFCCKCRAENVMDLPHWHWGQMVDSLCTPGCMETEDPPNPQVNGSIRASTAPIMPSINMSGSFSSADRMARLAERCVASETETNSARRSIKNNLRMQSTADRSHPTAVRLLSGDLDAMIGGSPSWVPKAARPNPNAAPRVRMLASSSMSSIRMMSGSRLAGTSYSAGADQQMGSFPAKASVGVGSRAPSVGLRAHSLSYVPSTPPLGALFGRMPVLETPSSAAYTGDASGTLASGTHALQPWAGFLPIGGAPSSDAINQPVSNTPIRIAASSGSALQPEPKLGSPQTLSAGDRGGGQTESDTSTSMEMSTRGSSVDASVAEVAGFSGRGGSLNSLSSASVQAAAEGEPAQSGAFKAVGSYLDGLRRAAETAAQRGGSRPVSKLRGGSLRALSAMGAPDGASMREIAAGALAANAQSSAQFERPSVGVPVGGSVSAAGGKGVAGSAVTSYVASLRRMSRSNSTVSLTTPSPVYRGSESGGQGNHGAPQDQMGSQQQSHDALRSTTDSSSLGGANLGYGSNSGAHESDGQFSAPISAPAFSPSATSPGRGTAHSMTGSMGIRSSSLRTHSAAVQIPSYHSTVAHPLQVSHSATTQNTGASLRMGSLRSNSLRSKSYATGFNPSHISATESPTSAPVNMPFGGVSAPVKATPSATAENAISGYLTSLRALSVTNAQNLPTASRGGGRKLASNSLRSPSRVLRDLAAVLSAEGEDENSGNGMERRLQRSGGAASLDPSSSAARFTAICAISSAASSSGGQAEQQASLQGGLSASGVKGINFGSQANARRVAAMASPFSGVAEAASTASWYRDNYGGQAPDDTSTSRRRQGPAASSADKNPTFGRNLRMDSLLYPLREGSREGDMLDAEYSGGTNTQAPPKESTARFARQQTNWRTELPQRQ